MNLNNFDGKELSYKGYKKWHSKLKLEDKQKVRGSLYLTGHSKLMVKIIILNDFKGEIYDK